jgi:hypothetical protein
MALPAPEDDLHGVTVRGRTTSRIPLGSGPLHIPRADTLLTPRIPLRADSLLTENPSLPEDR